MIEKACTNNVPASTPNPQSGTANTAKSAPMIGPNQRRDRMLRFRRAMGLSLPQGNPRYR